MTAITDTLSQPQFCPAEATSSTSKVKPIIALHQALSKLTILSPSDLRSLVDGLPPLDADAAKDGLQRETLYQLLKSSLTKFVDNRGNADGKTARDSITAVSADLGLACLQKGVKPPEDSARLKALQDAVARLQKDAAKKLQDEKNQKGQKEKADDLTAEQAKALQDKIKQLEESEADKLKRDALDKAGLQQRLQDALAGAGNGDNNGGDDASPGDSGSGSGGDGGGGSGSGSGGGSGSGSRSGSSPSSPASNASGSEGSGGGNGSPSIGSEDSSPQESKLDSASGSPSSDEDKGSDNGSDNGDSDAFNPPDMGRGANASNGADRSVRTPSTWSGSGGGRLGGNPSAMSPISPNFREANPAPISGPSSGAGFTFTGTPVGGAASFEGNPFSSVGYRAPLPPPQKFSYGRTTAADYGTATGGDSGESSSPSGDAGDTGGSVASRMQAAIGSGSNGPASSAQPVAPGVFQTFGKTMRALCSGSSDIGLCDEIARKATRKAKSRSGQMAAR